MDPAFIRLHQMGSTEDCLNGLLQQIADIGDHIQNAGVGASHQHRQTAFDLKGHAYFVTEVVHQEAILCPADEAVGNFLKFMDPWKTRDQPDAGI